MLLEFVKEEVTGEDVAGSLRERRRQELKMA